MLGIFQPDVDDDSDDFEDDDAEDLLFYAQVLYQERHNFSGSQRRQQARDSVIVPATAQPMNEDFIKTGLPIVSVTLDLSTNGIRLLSMKQITSPFIYVTVNTPQGDTLYPTAKVLRCQPSTVYFEVAGVFVKQFDVLG